MSNTTFMKKYPVLCLWACLRIQKYRRAFIHFAFVVWTSFSEQMTNMARLHARNVAESSKFLEVVFLKICRPILEWTVCWMLWLFKNVTSLDWSVPPQKNCEKTSVQSSYCFKRCAFWCNDWIAAHNIIRANKDHRVLAIKDFQDEDI